MSLTPKSVFRSLSLSFRQELLKFRDIQSTEDTLDGDFRHLDRKLRDTLEYDLNCIATLGSDYAEQSVHNYLSDAGWDLVDFASTSSARERACALLCRFPEDFAVAMRVWNANRMRGRLDRENGFRLPDLSSFTYSPLSDDQHAALETLVREAVLETFPAKMVSRVTVFERPSLGLPTVSNTVLQCDVSIGDDPEKIMVIEDGVEAEITITRLSFITAIIDPAARTLFVGTRLQNKALQKAVAIALVAILFENDAVLEPLKPLRVHPELCRSPVNIRYSTTDGLEKPRISELRYRLYGNPSSLQFSVREEDPEQLIHEHPDVERCIHRMRVWRAVIDFTFKARGNRLPIRRQVTLTEPDGVSFGGAFPAERLAIERVLTRSLLIDELFDWQAGARFSNIARLVVPHHLAELRQTWLPLTVKALEDVGILVQGPPHLRAWCRSCCATHEIERQETDKGDADFVLCPVANCALTPDHVDTLVLCPDGLLAWLREQTIQADDLPQRIGQASHQAWLLGPAKARVKGKPFQLILAFDVDLPETANALNEFLLHRYADGPGLILTLTEQPAQKC